MVTRVPKRKAVKMPKIKTSAGIVTGTVLDITDNSGARTAQVIAVLGYKGRKRRLPKAGVGDVVVVVVKAGSQNVRHQIFRAVIVRQRKPYRRKDGTWISFEDNAAVIIDEEGNPKGSIIKGPIAKEAAKRFPNVAKIATQIV